MVAVRYLGHPKSCCSLNSVVAHLLPPRRVKFFGMVN